MKKNMIYVLVVVALLLMACTSSAADPRNLNISRRCNPGTITYMCRIIDYEAGVVCWDIGDGAACLPMSQTLLNSASK